MNRKQLLDLKIGDRVKDKTNGEKGTITGWQKNTSEDNWDLSELFIDNDSVSMFPDDLIVLRKKQPIMVGVEWFARGGGLASMGPFPSQLKAWEAVMSYADPTKPIEGAIVWCARKKNPAKKV